jgi:hydroxymethylpyrimidine pyrophosphatase-like HAD family hydrolase
MGKILFIDVDGTLVDYQTNLPESAITAIRNAFPSTGWFVFYFPDVYK